MPEQPAENIYLISLPTPYPVGPVNCYLLDGPDPVLVDCGPATAPAETALRAGLSALGLQPRDLAQIVLTHHHPDHMGGLTWLATEGSAQVIGHRFNDLWLLNDPSVAQARVEFFVALHHYCGVADDLTEEIKDRFGDYGTVSRGIDIAVQERDVVDLAGSLWRVLETPGHAGTHIGLLREDGILLAGDTLLERISSNAFAEPPYPGQVGRQSSLLAYRRTLRRLAAEPLTLILPGHGNTFSGAAPLIERRLHAQEDRAQRLLAYLQAGGQAVLALSEALFPGLPKDQLFLGLSEVLGHLDLLEEQGLAEHAGEAPAVYRAL